MRMACILGGLASLACAGPAAEAAEAAAAAADNKGMGLLQTKTKDEPTKTKPVLRLEVALTTQASAVGMTRIWCGDGLSGTLSATEAQASGSREAWCRDNPQEGFWTTEIAAAPVGLNLRLSGHNHWSWLGLGANVSTAALSKAGIAGTDESAVSDVKLSPLKAMGGLDFAFPLSEDGQRLHFVVGGGGMWLTDERNVRIRPFYGVAVLVDLLHIARPQEAPPQEGGKT